MKPRKVKIGMTYRVQSDGRKKEEILINLSKHIDPNIFEFCIMGDGWGEHVKELRRRGFSVDYFDEFDYNKYVQLVPTFDYYLYWAHDEGNMGTIDALSAGVPTIVAPTGYHCDMVGGIVFEVENFNAILKAFDTITSQYKQVCLNMDRLENHLKDLKRKEGNPFDRLLDSMEERIMVSSLCGGV